jgi:hypothetical protein
LCNNRLARVVDKAVLFYDALFIARTHARTSNGIIESGFRNTSIAQAGSWRRSALRAAFISMLIEMHGRCEMHSENQGAFS